MSFTTDTNMLTATIVAYIAYTSIPGIIVANMVVHLMLYSREYYEDVLRR